MMRRQLLAILSIAIAVGGGTASATTDTSEPPGVTATTAAASTETELELFGEWMNNPTLPALPDVFASDTAAWVYAEGVLLLSEFGGSAIENQEFTVSDESLTTTGITITDVQFDDDGHVVDFTRNGLPISESIYRIGQPIEGTDEGRGLTGEIHSVRYTDLAVIFVVTYDNQSNVEAYISLDDFVSDGRQLSNVYANPARPSVKRANIDVFEDAPRAGGTAYGHVWAAGIGVTEFEVTVPAFGSPQPDPATATVTTDG